MAYLRLLSVCVYVLVVLLYVRRTANCGFMRFSICYTIVQKRGLFVHQSFFFYDRPIIDFLSYDHHKPVRFIRYCCLMWFDSHNSYINANKTFVDYLPYNYLNFGFFCLNHFVAFQPFSKLTSSRVIRLFKILTYRGRRICQRMPAHGQRTRSNSSITKVRRAHSTLLAPHVRRLLQLRK